MSEENNQVRIPQKIHIEVGNDKEMIELKNELNETKELLHDREIKLSIISDRKVREKAEILSKELGVSPERINEDNINAYEDMAKTKREERKAGYIPPPPKGGDTAWLNEQQLGENDSSLLNQEHDSPQTAIAFLTEISKNQHDERRKEAKQILDTLGRNVMQQVKKQGFELEYQGELKYLLGNRANPSFYKNENELLEKRTKELLNRTNWKKIS